MVNDYEAFKTQVLGMTKIDLNAYKEKQMKRRIDTLIMRHSLKNYDEFVTQLKSDTVLMEEFVNYLTINVSEFYRNPDQWTLLDSQIIPELVRKFGTDIHIWSAACSTGDEPYSLVMAFSKHIPLNRIKIHATDIDKQVLQKAKQGIYSEKSLLSVPKEFKDKYFEKIGASYRISDAIKSRVEFSEHNLLLSQYPKQMHFIVCRNVLIYFTEEAKEEVFRKFFCSLAPGGILFLGSTEQMMSYKQAGYERKGSFFFERPM